MPSFEIAKAWKDEEYRDTLTLEQRDLLPEHPSGNIEFQKPDRETENSFGAAPVAFCFFSHLKTVNCTIGGHYCK
jgi:mersacidin/lichenicidin family type 2 lantibiotic